MRNELRILDALLPTGNDARVKEYFTRLIDEARADVDTSRVVDGPVAMKRIEKRLRNCLKNRL